MIITSGIAMLAITKIWQANDMAISDRAAKRRWGRLAARDSGGLR